MTDISSKFTMPVMTIDDITSNNQTIPGIKRMIDIAAEIKDSILIHGPMGVGKSEAVRQWNADRCAKQQELINAYNEAVKENPKYAETHVKPKPWNPVICDVRLSMKEPVDLVGVPTIKYDTLNKDGSPVTIWATPSSWPQDNDEYAGGVIFLDEMNQGSPAILNASFQLILDRALGEYKVPENYVILGACNPPAFNPTVSEFSMPLANRFTHFNLGVDFKSWQLHAQNSNYHPSILAFMKAQGCASDLYDEEAINKRVGGKANTMFTDLTITPRSWEVASRVLQTGDKFSMIEKQYYITGRLGHAETARLFNFIKDSERYQPWQEILIEGKEFSHPDSVDQFYCTQTNCLSAINTENDDKVKRDYIVNFIGSTRKLKSDSLKIMNIIALSKLKAVDRRFDLFNPMKDAKDLIVLAADAL